MEYTIVKQEERWLVGLAVRTDNNRAMEDIPEVTAKFQEGWQEKINNCINDDIFCAYLEYEGDHTQPYTFIIGCQVDSLEDIPEGMVAKKLEGGEYAKIDVQGQYPHSLIGAWQNIWENDEALNRKYTTDFELYGQNFTEENNCQFSIYLALQEENQHDGDESN